MPTKATNLGEFLVKLRAMSELLCSPTTLLLEVSLPAINAKPNSATRMRFEAMRAMLLSMPVSLPDGTKQKLKTLQREYLRYRVVDRYRQTGASIEYACAKAADFLQGQHSASPETLRKSYFQMQAILTQENFSKFCAGLDYDFVIAAAGDETPEEGTYLHPDFLIE